MGDIDESHSFAAAVKEAFDTELALYEDLQLDLVSINHPLKEFFDKQLCSLPLVLVSKYAEPTGNTISSPQMNSTMNSDLNKSPGNYDGSPMKIQEFSLCSGSSFVASPTKQSLKPLDIHRARQLLSMMVMKEAEDAAPVLVLCDGYDKPGTVFLGCEKKLINDQSSILQYKVTNEGPIKGKNKLPKLESLVKRDLRRSNCKVTMHCKARYEIINQTNISHDSTITGVRGSLAVDLQWNKATSLLQAPPLDAYAVANATVVPGDLSSAAYLMYAELAILKNLAKGLQDGQVIWGVEEDDNALPLVEKTRELIEKVKRGESATSDDVEVREESEDEVFNVHNLTATGRVDLDFTEHLWNVLKTCSSYQDLIDSLQLVFRCLQSGDLQPMVHKENKCSMAGYIRDSYHGELKHVDLQGLTPLQIVSEIGLEKIRRDYINVMIGNDLVAASHIESLVQTSGTVIERVDRLEKLHHSLELVVMLLQYLKLQKLTLSITARNAIQYFEKNTIDKEHSFQVPVQTSNIAPLIEKRDPSLWKAELTNKIGSSEEHAVYLVSSKQQFEHIQSASNVTEEEDSLQQSSYYLTRATHQVLVL